MCIYIRDFFDKILTHFGDALCKKLGFFTYKVFARGCSSLQWNDLAMSIVLSPSTIY